MKEPTKILQKGINAIAERSRFTTGEVIETALSHIIFAFCGFFLSRGVVMDKFLPFGISAVAGCPYGFLPSAALGAVLGSIFPAVEGGGFRYIAAMFALLAQRLLVVKIKPLSKNPVFLAVICFLTTFLTGVATLKDISGGVAFSAVEAVLSGGGAYFLNRGIKSLADSETGLSGEQLTSVVISINMVILGLLPLAVYGVSLGRIVTALLILAAARYGGVGAGAVFGIACAVCAALGGENTSIQIMLCFAALMAGVFSEVGKIGETAAFFCAAVIGAIIGGFTAVNVKLLIECALGSAIWLVLPKNASIKVGRLFSGRVATIKPDGLKKGLTMRLKAASKALGEVSKTVDSVAGELSRINSPDFKTVLQKTESDACKGCSLQIYCWETKYDETLAAVIEMTKAVKRGESSPEQSATAEFKGRCLRVSRIGGATLKYFSEYASAVSAEKRVEEVRSVVADQFSGISQMLLSLADEYDTDERFDTAAAARIAAALKNIGYSVKECGVRLDKDDRMTVEIRIKTKGDSVLNRVGVMRALSVACDRDFEPPCVTVSGEDTYLTACEHAYFTAEIGVSQICSENAAVCGDAYEYFFDGKGKLIMILSDGMGTGGRAAVDGAMASGLMTRLIKAGFGFDAALKIINSSMLFKSTDESTATVDIVAVDLFTGRTELLKAGAAPTVVRRNGRSSKAQSSSLPAGILRNVSFDKAVITLRKNDIVLMLSDGAVSEGTEWISAELESWGDGSAQALAERISAQAKRRRSDSHQDDITVMAAVLQKAM